MVTKKKEEEKLPPPPKPVPMTDEEVLEWEQHFEKEDLGIGMHRPDLYLLAGIGRLLVEIVKNGRK